MKNFYGLFLIVLYLFFSNSTIPQINDIMRLPVQNPNQSFRESAPVWISENEMMIFYVSPTNDTIYSCRSRNRGIAWEDPEVIQIVQPNHQSEINLCALKIVSGRLLVAWSIKYLGMNIIYSDDNGSNWSEPQLILGGGAPSQQIRSSNLNFTQLLDGRIILSFNWFPGTFSYYKISNDDGETWSEEAIDFAAGIGEHKELSIISVDKSTLMGVFQLKTDSDFDIYKKVSTDNGLTWTDTIKIISTELEETRPRISKKSNGTLILTYIRENPTDILDYKQKDVRYLESLDNGISWGNETSFTSYVGNDDLINCSLLNDKILLSFTTSRFTEKLQVCFAVIGETIESFTPPLILDFNAPFEQMDPELKEFVFKATVIDDNKVENVKVDFDETRLVDELYDDGLHYDDEANDNVFGNKFEYVLPQALNQYEFDVNKLILPMDTKGILADVLIRYDVKTKIVATDDQSYQHVIDSTQRLYGRGSTAKYDEGSFLFSGGFVLSGLTNGELWANAVASATIVEDYLPGMAGSDPENYLNRIYIINKNDPPFGYSWQIWKDAVSLGAEFYDGDGDNIYNPIDKNWNGTWDSNEDMPHLLGDATAWCVYNDGKPSNQRRWNTVEPQGIEIRQTLFASSLSELENIIFIEYSILNTGTVSNNMDSVYFGIWADGDLGDATDDLVGCDTVLNSAYYYNNTYDYVYGNNCPAFFATLLQGPIFQTGIGSDTATINNGTLIGSERITNAINLSCNSHVFMSGGDPYLRDPNNKVEARNYNLGGNRLGDIPDPCIFPYCEVRGEVDCWKVNPLFWASGDPVTDYGWIQRFNGDHRNMISTGPFNLEKDEPQKIIIAYVLGRGTDPLNSITVARENVSRAFVEYESNFTSMTYSPPPATNPVTDYILYHNYPNPFNPTTTIRYELPQEGLVTIDIYDILGQRVRTILNEFQNADRYEVEFNAIGLASGVYIYRMKVNDFIASKKMLLLR